MSHFKLILVGSTVTLTDDSDGGVFTITQNSGLTANPVVATLTAPAGLTIASGTPSQGTFDTGTGIWQLGALPSGTVATLDASFTVTATTGVPWTINLASTAYAGEVVLANNSADREIDGATCGDINQCSNKTTLTSIGAGNYSILTTDVTVVKTAHTGGGDTLTLPSGAATGQIFAIHDLADAGAENITIDTAGAELIDGQSTTTMDVDLRYLELMFDGTDYWTRNYKEWSFNGTRNSMAIGSDFSGHSGAGNIAIGNTNLEAVTFTSGNISIGAGSMPIAAISSNNVAVGTNTLAAATNTSSNIAIGTDALSSVTTQGFGIAIGHGAAQSNTSGVTLSIGYNAGQNITNNLSNILLGHQVMSVSTGSVQNVVIGPNGFNDQSGGAGNSVGIGYNVGNSITTGEHNTYIGSEAGFSSLTGSRNVFVGYQAGYNELLSDKLYIANSNTATPLIWGDFNTPKLTVNGEFGWRDGKIAPYTSVAAGNYNVLTTDHIIWKTAITGGGDQVILPSTALAGQIFIIKDVSGGSFTDNITITTAGAELIDGIATKVINVDYNSITVMFDGANYGII